MSIKVVITNLDYGQNYDEYIRQMASSGIEAVWVSPFNYSSQETVRVAKGFDAVIAGGEQYDRPALEQLRDRLKIIARHGTGIDNIDIKAATELGIAVTNAAGRNARPVAEHAVGMMLALTRKICQYNAQMHRGVWSPAVSKELYGKTVGIVGFGAIGRWLASLLKGFSCRILVYDKVPCVEAAKSADAEYVSLDYLLAHSDFVSLHLPLTQETRGSIGNEFFRKMKPTAIFVNTSRGKIVRENELVEALQAGIIAGACLDVFANPPINESHPLCGMQNVVMSPHTSAVTEESMDDTFQCVLNDIIDFFAGLEPANLLNPDYRANLTGAASYE
ncbi:MAG TPA: phosphoglycerate dehydrogenase [Armatimonadota bacterium]|nr:phosphoglycerate dehydrogenase [Armatimonadota bacterium]